MLEDPRVNVRIKLSALWASVVLCYIYCDYFELYRPGKLSGMLQGNIGPLGPVTQGKLLGTAILLAVPSVMVFLSLVLPPRVDRWVNILLGTIYTLMMLLIAISPGAWTFYRF